MHVQERHGLAHYPSEHTGLFLDPTHKLGSIGVQIRHRLTTHGFSLNVTQEPKAWFDQVVACGLADVKAECISVAVGKEIGVEKELSGVVETFGKVFGRDMERLGEQEKDIAGYIREVEEDALRFGSWRHSPTVA